MRFFSWLFLVSFFVCFSCSRQSAWSSKALELDRFCVDLVNELQEVQSQKDLEERKDQIKNLFQPLVQKMIDLDRERRSHGFDKEVRQRLVHLKQLGKELKRIQMIAGCKEIIENCQRDALHLLDSYDRKLQRVDPFITFKKNYSSLLR
ncbi:MAG: hypothetical protein KGQ54_03225 [Verrucomicrobia bacterium]|nr:hypothetical protein [Verrucomicrobiota bacterium]